MPILECEAKLFLRDGDGKHIPWSKNFDYGDISYDRCNISFSNNRYALVVSDNYGENCRETVCNSFAYFFQELRTPPDACVCFDSPKNKNGALLVPSTSTLGFRIKGFSGSSVDAYDDDYGQECDHPLYKRVGELAKTKKGQKEVFALMDAFLGPMAMLLGGPSAYTRRGINAVYPAKGEKIGRLNDGGTTTWYKTVLEYDGVSNFWLRHPAYLSLALGIGRLAIELWCDKRYETADKKIDITATRSLLNRLRKKKTLTTAETKKLIGKLKVMKSLLATAKVRANPGAYPINEYTWGMFLKLIKAEPVGLSVAWDSVSHDSIYSHAQPGFLQWCKSQKKKTKKFASGQKRNWNATSGVQIV